MFPALFNDVQNLLIKDFPTRFGMAKKYIRFFIYSDWEDAVVVKFCKPRQSFCPRKTTDFLRRLKSLHTRPPRIMKQRQRYSYLMHTTHASRFAFSIPERGEEIEGAIFATCSASNPAFHYFLTNLSFFFIFNSLTDRQYAYSAGQPQFVRFSFGTRQGRFGRRNTCNSSLLRLHAGDRVKI